MKIKLGTISLALMILGSGVSAAHAAEPTSIETRAQGGIAWIDAIVAAPSDDLQIRIMAPERNGHRRTWQTCRFAQVTVGAYSCGIDASTGSLAGRQTGTWIAKVFIGGERVARAAFSL